MASFSPIPSPPLLLKLSSSSSNSSLWAFRILTVQNRSKKKQTFLFTYKKKQAFQLNAVYTQGLSLSSSTSNNNLSQRKEKYEVEQDSISVLNQRIRKDFGNREATRPVMDSEEADKYIQMVKQQQQIGLQKLKGKKGGGGVDDGGDDGSKFSYKADPYSLRSGDYVVHKKVGIGRFVGIKFDVPKSSAKPIEYVFIEYADGMAKLPVKQASRMLYRYSL